MRSKHFVRKAVNLILVMTVSLSLAVARPAYLYAGPCADGHIAAYADTMAGLLATLEGAQATHDDAVEVYQAARQAADETWATAAWACQGDYNAGSWPCTDALEEALEFLEDTLEIELLGCFLTPDPPHCAAVALVIHAGLIAGVWATYAYCIYPVNAAFNECMDIANGVLADAVADANAAYDPASAAWTDANVAYWVSATAAEVTLAENLAGCPDPDE